MFAAKRSIKKAYKLKAGGEFEQEKIATTFKRGNLMVPALTIFS